jgi:hypothetical protein
MFSSSANTTSSRLLLSASRSFISSMSACALSVSWSRNSTSLDLKEPSARIVDRFEGYRWSLRLSIASISRSRFCLAILASALAALCLILSE